RIVVSELRLAPARRPRVGPSIPKLRGKGSPTVPRGGITARLVRRIPVHQHIEEMMRQPALRRLVERFFAKVYEATLRPGRVTAPTRTGRPPLSVDVLLEVAVAYTHAVQARRPHPVQHTAETLGITPTRARDLVHQARVRGLVAQVSGSGV